MKRNLFSIFNVFLPFHPGPACRAVSILIQFPVKGFMYIMIQWNEMSVQSNDWINNKIRFNIIY